MERIAIYLSEHTNSDREEFLELFTSKIKQMCESVSDYSYSAYSPRERAIQDREREDTRIRFMKEEDRRWGHDNSDYYSKDTLNKCFKYRENSCGNTFHIS